MDDSLLDIVNGLLKTETKIYMILLIGYFRAKPVIPHFQLCDTEEDTRYICDTFKLDIPRWDWSVSKGARANMVSQTLSALGFSQLKQEQSRRLSIRLADVATISTEPKYILDECLAFLGQNRIALPGYSTLQDLVTATLTAERNRTTQILSERMSATTQEKLSHILNDKGVLNGLSGFKGTARDFSPSELERELSTMQLLRTVYPEVKQLLSELGLSRGNMIYYTSLIRSGSTFQLRRSPKWQGLLYLSCYIFYRYREANDRLVSSFNYLVRKHHESRIESARSRVAKELDIIQDTLKSAGNILRYFTDDNISDNTTFGELRKTAFSTMSPEDILLVSTHLVDGRFNRAEYQWQYTDSQSRKTAGSLRKLFLALDIECEAGQPALRAQISNAREELLTNKKLTSMDLRLVTHSDLKHLVTDGDTNRVRFEFYLYRKISGMIDTGKVYVSESERNKRLEDDLIPLDVWKKDKASLIEKTGLERLSNSIEHTLAELDNRFVEKLGKVTANINADANDFVRVQPRSSRLAWSLANRRWKTPLDNPVYSQVQHMGIIDIMNYVSRKTGYLEAFESLSLRKRNTEARSHDLIACIFGNGANYGLHRLATSSDRSIGILRSVNDSYIRPETTGAANDLISNALARLPIFRHYTINESAPFGSIDGQKHACRINTFKARYSAKYFQKGKGVSAMTLVSNHVPLNTTVISANEYEGHYAFDLLYNNSSDIQPKSLATDNHGTNNVNFAVLDIFGYQFSPRYAKFKHAFENVFEVNIDGDLEIKIKKPIRIKLIKEEWERIQHIICSLSRKSTEQHVIIRKLSNSKRGSRTLAALREYDRLIKCLYMLDYIDRKDLRQFVQQALNRGEAYHQLRRAIGNLNGDQLRGGNDYQVEQWNDCARLIANCIIYHNSALLSALVERFEKQKNDDAIDLLANISPVAWGHIQLTGHYVFEEKEDMLNLESMIESVHPITSDAELGDITSVT
ncbi:Tn3 family transposase [Vibrio atlanticus]|uniref:Tn3 family transposase n=1 Tax=Vibrio atlanticus TaxID=693153 RepID=UPI003550406F